MAAMHPVGAWLDVLGGVAQAAAGQRANEYWAVIAPGWVLLIEHASDENENVPVPIPPIAEDGTPGWWADDRFTLPEDFFAVTANSTDGVPAPGIAAYVTNVAMEAVYDGPTRRRTADPVPVVPLMQGAHNHADGPAPDPSAPGAAVAGGTHPQYTGDGAHVHRGGRHAHDLITPPALRPLQVGDRVIVRRVAGKDWVVVARPLPARVFVEATPPPRVGWTA